MEGLPPGALILMVAALSASAGALLTWLITHIGRARDSAPRDTSQQQETSASDLLRVVRTKGKPSIIVQGKRLRHLREIKDRDTGQETILAVKAVLAFAEGWLPALGEERRALSSADAPPTTGITATPRSIHQTVRMSEQQAGESSSAEPLKLVEEINALIQKRLHERPDLAKQGIQLTRDIDGRPLIYVGKQPYHSAEEIPDDQVRVFIRETIQIWESR